jgi:hypothetical protein
MFFSLLLTAWKRNKKNVTLPLGQDLTYSAQFVVTLEALPKRNAVTGKTVLQFAIRLPTCVKGSILVPGRNRVEMKRLGF